MTKVEGGGVPVGTQLNGIYEIDERVAMGGMGEVYIGHNIQTGDKVAIKMILPELAHNQVILDLFRKEASTLNRLYHEAIVRYYVFSVDPELDRPYLAMEYAGGASLVDRLRERPLNSRELDVLRHRIASGLAAAHKLGVFHRDISPDNVILVNGEVEQAKIIDFGIAKSTSAEGTLIGGGFAGKLNYVSPEQLGLGGGDVTAKSDIYSLGLVLAEAAIGRPLPMSGTQVEVLEKRRSVPDLADVPADIRPLIEWMLQPEAADRPEDMNAVANWGGGAAAEAAPVTAAPRQRRAAQQGEPKKKGFPWLIAGLGTAVVAGGAVFFLMQGGEAPAPKPGPGVSLSPSLKTGTETAATLKAPAAAQSTPEPAHVGATYTWVSPPFDYTGDKKKLTITLSGKLPKGLEFEKGDDGTGVVFGIPAEAGEAHITIEAKSPEGQTASQSAVLTVAAAKPAEPAPAVLPKPVAVEPVEAKPAQQPKPDLSANAPEPVVVGTAPTLKPIDTSEAEPKLATGGASGAVGEGAGAIAGLPKPGQTGITAPALTTSPVDTTQGDPSKDLPDVRQPNAPAVLAQPGAGAAGSGITQAGSGASATVPAVQPGQLDQPFVIPRTGSEPAIPPQQPAPAAQDNSQVASVNPTAQNLPPKILDHITTPIEANSGDEINLRLGAFDDEDGADALNLRVDGRLPNGMQFVKAPGGVAQLYGKPAESGNFSFEVVAVDPKGLVSKFPVTLDVASPVAFRDLRNYIVGYNGGNCFLSRPMQLGEKTAQIEVFASDVNPVLKFDADFKAARGFEANIGMRQITPAQCALIAALDQVGPNALDNRLTFRIAKDQLRSGETLAGTVVGAKDARVFLFDDQGGVNDLGKYLKQAPDGTAFSLPLHADGPQVLVAAIAEPASGLGGSAGLEQLLGAAKRGQASLALGYIIVKK